jgi:hypothetical protein
MGTQPIERHGIDPTATKLIALSRNAHVNVDTSDPADYWYRLGQRNAYAHSAGLALARGADERAFEISDRITTSLDDGRAQLETLERLALGESAPSTTPATPMWIGPNAFAAMCGDIPGIDRDFGMRWGDRGDQRISLRRTPDADTGLLYAHDPLWDEYAVLGANVPAKAVEAAFAQAMQVDVHMDVGAFNEIVRSHMLLGPALPAHAPRAGRVIEP